MKLPIPDLTNKTLLAMTVAIFIYPIIPLAIMSLLVVVSILGSFVSGKTSTGLFPMIYILLWMLGGTVGFVGILKILFNKRTTFSLVLFVWGTVSYSIVVVFFIRGSLQRLDFFSNLHGAYLMISLVIIGIQLILTIQSIRKEKIRASLN